MNPENNTDCTSGADNDLSLDESRELLTEVRCATDPQSGLHGFAGLLCQLIELHDRIDDGDSDEIAKFIGQGLDEVRSVMADDAPTSDKLQSLQEHVVDCWGSQLEPLEPVGDDASDDIDAWGSEPSETDSQDSHDDGDELDNLVAPSADEISSLLTQLGNPAAPHELPVENSAEENQTTPPAAQQSDQPAEGLARSFDQPAEGLAHSFAQPTVTVDSLDPELREAFLDDASGCVSSMEDALLRLESDPTDGESLNQMCRELHTLKGASASVGLSDLADQLHHLEDSLRDDQAAGRAPEIDALLKCVDSVRAQISGQDDSAAQHEPAPAESPSAAENAPATETPVQPAPAKINSFAEGPADDESVRVKSSQLNRLMDMLAELVMLRNRRETELSELQGVYHELIGSVSKMRLLSNEGQFESTGSKSLQLSEVANDVLEAAQHLRDCARPVAEGNTAVSAFIRQFRQELVELRRTPVSGLFRRLQRVVRDAAQAESKRVRLQLVGEDAGIERSLQQRLYEPMLHIVRNCVCHGIEDAAQRARLDKDPVGTITLEAKSGPELFMIEIRDDGGGLDYDAIRRRGVDSGLISANQVPSRQELAQLIFQPGFSTRQTANQVAGRGVGMDVVASTLQRMRGWLEVDSEPNQGTRIRLSFPLPSVIQHAMVFRSAGQLFALPMQSVQTAGEVTKDSLCLTMSELLGGQPETASESYQRIVLARDSAAAHGKEEGTAPVTLLVDEIIGPEELVVRPLPSLLKQHPFCGGATLSGMGQTVLLLDAHRVIESQSRRLRNVETASLGSDEEGGRLAKPRVLVVDDSLSARKRVVRSLRRYPVDIVEAPDGKDALELLKREQFDAVFSDMEMPHVNGMELLSELASDPQQNTPPVVIISSRNEEEFTARARELGANNYLIKPLTDEALDEALAGLAPLQHLQTTSASTLQPIGEIQ